MGSNIYSDVRIHNWVDIAYAFHFRLYVTVVIFFALLHKKTRQYLHGPRDAKGISSNSGSCSSHCNVIDRIVGSLEFSSDSKMFFLRISALKLCFHTCKAIYIIIDL